MTKNRAHNLAKYAFTKGEPVLLDTNVWLFLFPAPQGKVSPFAAQYSAAFKQIMQAGSLVILDVLILSEYINRYCRIEFTALHRAKYNDDFKKFRQSKDFTSVGQGAVLFARQIAKLCSRKDHPFSAPHFDQVLTDFESGICDFNDGLLIESCRVNGWRFVTNDGDCTNGGIDVLTTNPRLIAACPR